MYKYNTDQLVSFYRIQNYQKIFYTLIIKPKMYKILKKNKKMIKNMKKMI